MAIYNPKSLKAEEFINHEEILDTIRYAQENKHNVALIDELLEKARPKKTDHGTFCAGLTHREASVLLACDIPEKVEQMYQLAAEIKDAFYGNRIVLFAPLYLSNYCINGCVYCPYHRVNQHITRKKLTQEEVRAEVMALQDMGHKRLAIEAGEDPVNNPIEYILECIHTIYSIHNKNGDIRRVNVNIAATTVENYRKLKDAGIGTYILFQETYNKKSYLELHPTGPKHDYDYHTEAMDRAMDGGIDDVGLGVLFGLERLPVRVRRPAHARRAPGSRPRRGTPHHQRPPRQEGGRHRPGRVRQRPGRRYVPEDHRLHPHRRPLHRHDHLHP